MSTAKTDLKIQTTEATSLEQVQIQIGGDKPGEPRFRMHLLMNTSAVTGLGRITQATNPPVEITTHLAGRTSLIVFGADVTRTIQLTGNEFPHATQPGTINVRNCDIALHGAEGTIGTANYEYLENGQWKQISGPAKADWSKGNF